MIGPTGLESNCHLRVVCNMLLCTYIGKPAMFSLAHTISQSVLNDGKSIDGIVLATAKSTPP